MREKLIDNFKRENCLVILSLWKKSSDKFKMVKRIKGIPTYVIDGHQEAYHLWRKLGVKGKSLVHVDAHSDMWDCVEKIQDGSYNPNCGNYLLPSIKQKIVKDVWWINPFSVSKYCLNLVDKEHTPNTITYNSCNQKKVFWENETFRRKVTFGERLPTYQNPEIGERQYILDIDLDAFSCCRAIPLLEFPNPNSLNEKQRWLSEEKNYPERISRVLSTLEKLEKPEMIIIAESQEKNHQKPYIRPKYVRSVKRKLILGLERIFS